jgi:hypothetical protein
MYKSARRNLETPLNAFDRRLKKAVVVAALAMFLTCVRASADVDDADAKLLSFSGFGTLGEVNSSEVQADFLSNAGTLVPNGAGHTREWSPDVDSRLGAQVAASLTSQLTAVVQVVSEQRANNSFAPGIEWANIKYAFSPDFSVGVGRTVLPAFLTSDYRLVGFANPWVRPPIEVYSLLPITSNDGVDVTYRFHSGDIINTLQGVFGSKDSDAVGGGTVKARDTIDLSDSVEYGALTLHSTYHQVKVALPGTQSFPIKLVALGGDYDPGTWFVMGEWAANRSVAFGDSDGWYVTGGYRIKQFTPYVTYSRLLPLTNPGLGFPAAGQRNESAGIRWDFHKNFDLKLQLDHINLDAGSAGTLGNIQPGFRPGEKVDVTSVTVDFVY